MGFLFASGNTTRVSAKGLQCCVYEKNNLSGLFPFRGRLSGAALARSLALRARQPPDYPLASVLATGFTPRARPSGGLTQWYAPSQFIPFNPFLFGGILLVVLPHVSFLTVFAVAHAICEVSRLSGTLLIPCCRARGVACWKPSPAFSWCSRQNLLCVKAAFACASENTVVFCLDPQILACPSDLHGWRRLLGLSQSERG